MRLLTGKAKLLNNAHRPVAMICRCLLMMVVGSGQLSAAANESEMHSHDAIRAAAEAEVESARLTLDGRYDVVADRLDSRVRLAACSEPLTTSTPYEIRRSSRVTVEVRCVAPKPWKLYVPVRLTIYQDVLVAARRLPRGAILAPGDIILAERDTAALARGYMLQAEHAVGHRLRRAVTQGKALTPAMLESPVLIRRGQMVNLEARSGGLTVKMMGIARSNGILGQIIDVENKTTSRRVQAIVRSRKSAEVLLN